jgi:hypothetical protein
MRFNHDQSATCKIIIPSGATIRHPARRAAEKADRVPIAGNGSTTAGASAVMLAIAPK